MLQQPACMCKGRLLYSSQSNLQMKSWLTKIYTNRLFLLFIMLFAYVQSIFIRLTAWEEVTVYTFTPEAMIGSLYQAGILFAIILFLIKKFQHSELLSTSELLKIFSLSLLLYLLTMKGSGLLLSFLFDTIERNFNQKTFFFTLLSDFLNGLIYGSFFLAYYYYQKYKQHQQQLALYHQALSESRIQQLKWQLNPHFLFNNLNVLDQLIDEDKQTASTFLHEFADIYRYVLQSGEQKLVPLADELAFAKQYMRLLQQKFGNAYQINIKGNYNNGYIAPLTLQLLIENALQHNLGTAANPVIITIHIGDAITVVNNVALKQHVKATNGRALNNLKEQYKLLAKAPVTAEQLNGVFKVTIPAIYQLQTND